MTAPSKPIRLIDPLPCATMADTPTGICGRPAYAAHAWQQERIDLDWNPPGLWTLQPVCETCAHAGRGVVPGDTHPGGTSRRRRIPCATCGAVRGGAMTTAPTYSKAKRDTFSTCPACNKTFRQDGIGQHAGLL